MEGTSVSVAAIDIGSNSVRLLILSDSGVELCREATITALGRGVAATSMFRSESVAATLETIRAYSKQMQQNQVSTVAAVATSASRDAENAGELMDEVSELIGARPQVISGAREAELSFAGATGATPHEPPHVVIDIGGGSTEFVYGVSAPEYSISVDIGTVRLSDGILTSHPAQGLQMAEAAVSVADAFSRVELPGRAETVHGVAGTFTSLAAIHLDLETYDRDRVHGSILTSNNIEEVIERLSGLTVDETAAIASLDPGRAPVILAGALIAREALAAVGAGDVRVSEFDLLDGLARSLLKLSGTATP